jgi:hypothetical protein
MSRLPFRESDRKGRLKQHLKVQSFRFTTVVVAWVLIGLAFYYRPDLIKQALRAGTRAASSLLATLCRPHGETASRLFSGKLADFCGFRSRCSLCSSESASPLSPHCGGRGAAFE